MLRQLSLALLLGTFSLTASAWSRPGHMVTGAIVFDELSASDPQALAQIIEIMARHPERAPFEVAVGRESGDERVRRLLMQMARWADDIRGGAYDHPTWHYSGRALSDAKRPPAQARNPDVAGAALEALTLNAVVAADKNATPAERAVSLCWLFHLVGDVHQPLHAADQVSATLPDGDRGGGLAFLLDPQTRQPITLHTLWDNAPHGSPEAASASARARELRARYPRSAFPELSTRPEGVRDFGAWARESFDLARTLAYGPDSKTAAVETEAALPSEKYVKDSLIAAERRVTLAGYRLADLMRALLRAQPATQNR